MSQDIVNGERNRINLLIENNSDLNVTLISIAGSFHDAQTDALIKNVRSSLLLSALQKLNMCDG